MNFDVALFYVKSTSPLKFREKAGKPPESELISIIFRGLLKKSVVLLNLKLSLGWDCRGLSKFHFVLSCN